MKTSLKTMSIISVVLGGLAIIDGLTTLDGYALLGGSLFLAEGILALVYIGQNAKL